MPLTRFLMRPRVLLARVRFAARLTHVSQARTLLGCRISEWSCWALEEAMLPAPCRKGESPLRQPVTGHSPWQRGHKPGQTLSGWNLGRLQVRDGAGQDPDHMWCGRHGSSLSLAQAWLRAFPSWWCLLPCGSRAAESPQCLSISGVVCGTRSGAAASLGRRQSAQIGFQSFLGCSWPLL